MNDTELQNMWYYFLDLEKELADSSRYIEPEGQEDVYSFEFRKIIILACTECETAFKALCEIIDQSKNRGSIGDYKGIILGKYPKLVEAKVTISRWHKTIQPFKKWDTGKLEWWDVHQAIKHDRGSNLKQATYQNAVYTLSALYVLIFYLYRASSKYITELRSYYITSQYAPKYFVGKYDRELPDFE